MWNASIGLFGLLFLFRKFEFDSKSKFVEEGLLRYRNFWPAFLYRKCCADRAKLTAKLTPVKAKMALRFKSTDDIMALISTLISCDLNLQTITWRCYLSILSIYIRNSCLLFFSTISGLPFSFKNQFNFKSNFVEEILERLGISGLPFSIRKFQFDSKSIFVEQNLERLGISGLLISFRMFQFDSKSNSVEESLQRYRSFWAAFFIQKVSIWFQIEFRRGEFAKI